MNSNPLPQEVVNTPAIVPPAVGATTLVTNSDTLITLTAREETDAVGAMRRGLREYLEQVSKDVAGSRVRFQGVFEEWASPDDNQDLRYPAAAVLLADGSITYDASTLTPMIQGDTLPDGRFVVKVSEVTTVFMVECHCASKGERQAIGMMLEEALNPVDWRNGFALDCPHYFGQRAVFEVTGAQLPDDAISARHGLRKLSVLLSSRINVVRPHALPPLAVKLNIDEQAPGDKFAFPITGLTIVNQGKM